jgi:hypothetical protein
MIRIRKKGFIIEMKKIAILILSICLLVAFAATPAMAANGTGFDQNGVNLKARVFNGWLGDLNRLAGDGDEGTENTWMILKWSKDWAWGDTNWLPPDDATAVGAWLTVHQTQYLNESNQLLEWVDKNSIPNDAFYRLEVFQKAMKVSNNLDAWEAYDDGGAIDLGWGNYEPSGVPKYVLFQMTFTFYEQVSPGVWVLIYTEDICTTSPKGLGHPLWPEETL